MIDALNPPLVDTSTERGKEKYTHVQRRLLETSLIFASFLDITALARFRGWKNMRMPELENLFRFYEIPQEAFNTDGVSAFTHVVVDHYADILHAIRAAKQIVRVPVPKRLEKIAPSYADSIHSDLIHILARPPTYIEAVRQSLQQDPTGASWLQRQIAIDEHIKTSSPSEKVMMQAAVVGARKLFTPPIS